MTAEGALIHLGGRSGRDLIGCSTMCKDYHLTKRKNNYFSRIITEFSALFGSAVFGWHSTNNQI